MTIVLVATFVLVVARSAVAATPPTLNLNVLLIGTGSSDPTTAAWQSALSSEGVAYTLATATGTYGAETVTLPTLSSGTTGNFNGVVIADSPAAFAAGQLTSLFSYESTHGVRQIDGYTAPYAGIGLTEVSTGALDGTNGTLTAAGLAGLPGLAGTVPFSTGTNGYWGTVVSGAPFTPWLDNASGQVLAGVYQHPSTDPQAGVAELALTFDYNATMLQWELLAPGLINWVTEDTHLGLNRNYVEMDIDDTFTPDNAWSTAVHDNDYSDADSLRMQPSDVVTAAQWSQTNGFRMDQLFNYGGTVEYQNGELDLPGEPTTTGPDPLLAEFQATDPTTGKPYSSDFGWLSHTYDTPYLDVGCATQNYIEAELNENTSAAAAAPGSTAGTGGLGLTVSTDTSQALGTENPQVFVPGNHSGFADLAPGTPATVDPPDLDTETVSTTGGTLAAGSYEYAVTDQFNGADSPSVDQSQAYVTTPLTVPAGGSVSLVWQAICHAANYLVYREVAGSNNWSLIGTYPTPSSATLPDNSSGDPTSVTDVTNGGEQGLTYTDTGAAGTAQVAGWTPPVVENAVELPWEQNPYFIPALEAVGITTVGADASKAYPTTPDDQFCIGVTYTGTTYPAGTPFVDGTSEVAPRHPINIFYNASTEAQELDEYNTLYTSTAPNSQCTPSATTTCATTPYTFPEIVNNVVSGMFTNMLSNNPEPTYVHQTNLMGTVPYTTVLPPAGYTPPATPDTTGDGLLYSVLNPLLADYHSYFTSATPYEQLTLGAIGTTLGDQTNWSSALTAGTVKATETNGVVTVTNSGTGAVNVPVTVPPGTTVGGAAFGQSYAGELSDWTSVPAAGTTTLTENVAPAITSANAATSIVGAPFSTTVTTTGEPAPAITETGALPAGITFVDNSNGTASLAGTATAGTGASYPITITATNASGTATQAFTLTNSEAPTITSAPTASFYTGVAGTYTVTTTGYPAATITETGALPTGLTFTDKGNGTATIAGIPAAGTSGKYPVTISAANSSGSTVNLALAVTVTAGRAPVITSGATAYFTLNGVGAFAVSTTGAPPPAITEVGALPAGLTFTDNNNGTALLSGTPTASGTTTLSVTAANGITPNATQTLTVIVGQVPAITSAASTTFTTGAPGTFSVTTTEYPAPTLTETGALPAGVTFTDNGKGTATLAGTAAAGTGSSYPITITATNGTSPHATQRFTLKVDQAPAITSATSTTFAQDAPGTFSVTTSGYPAPTLTETGGLPTGVTFTDNGSGAATLAGTAAWGSAGSYPVTITAANGTGSDRTQSFSITVPGVPALAGGDRLAATPDGTGYWIVGPTGSLATYGTAGNYGSMAGHQLNRPIVGVGSTPDGKGYWMVASDGGVFSFGDAQFHGSMGGVPLNMPIVGIAGTPDGKGYWMVASDGGVFSFGDAGFYGSTGNIKLNKPIVGMASTPDGTGYWLVASDGGVFTFGDGQFYGSTGNISLNKPVIGMTATRDGHGYWLVASDGGIFNYGDAGFYGSGGSAGRTAVGLIASPTGPGYSLIDTDGTRTAFGG